MRLHRFLVCLAALAGSCDSGNRPAPAALQPDVAITAANALDVAGAAYRTAFTPVRVARIATAFFEVPPPEPPPSPGSLAVISREIEGPEGGSAIWTWADHDDDESYSSGDAFTIVFAGYGEDGLLLTGAATFDDVTIQGNVSTSLNWIVAARLQLLGLQVTSGASASTLDGAFRCTREQRATVHLLAIDAQQDVVVGSRTLHVGSELARNDYVLDFTMGLFAEGSFADPLLAGTLTFRTGTPMTGIQVLPDPGTGEFTVVGANGTALTLVPIDYFTLEILVDENGDGEIDATIPTEWAAL